MELCEDIQGCYGARMTGAGWGGCMVALVKKEEASAFMKKLETEYYALLEEPVVISEVLFHSEPADGARIYTCEDVFPTCKAA